MNTSVGATEQKVSCPPAHISNNIPYSLAYRTVPANHNLGILKSKGFSSQQGLQFFNCWLCDIVRAKAIPTEVDLKKVKKNEKPDGVIISISFNLSCISFSIQKLWEPCSRILGWRRFFKIHRWLPIEDLLISSEPELQILLEWGKRG